MPAPEFPLRDARKGAADALFNLAALFRQDATMATALSFGRLGLHLDADAALGLMTVAEIVDGMDQRDEADKPLAAYRADELARMRRNFYGFDSSYHVARSYFVRKTPPSWTPRHLARHRAGAAPRRAA